MRLQLIAAAIGAMVAAPCPVAADGEATGTVRVYADDDRVTVVSPAASAAIDVGDELRVELAATADAITAASVDVVTSASPATVHDLRVEGRAAVGIARDTARSAGAGVAWSHERDYDAVRAWVDAGVALAARATELTAVVEVGRDRARDVADPAFAGERRGGAVAATLTQLVDRRTVVDLTVEGSWWHGWHASPYRRVAIERPGLPLGELVREATPARRRALAARVQGRRAVGETWSAAVALGAYRDDWRVSSATVEVGVRRAWAPRLLAGVQLRGYVQDAAWFHAPRHALVDGAPPPLRSADRTLGAMATASATAVGDLALADPDDGPRLIVAAGTIAQWFRDDPRQRARRALTLTISVEHAW